MVSAGAPESALPSKGNLGASHGRPFTNGPSGDASPGGSLFVALLSYADSLRLGICTAAACNRKRVPAEAPYTKCARCRRADRWRRVYERASAK
jgi:hypothetical protein